MYKNENKGFISYKYNMNIRSHPKICNCDNENIKKQNSCENEINYNTVYFLLKLKYDIMSQESFVTDIQKSIHTNPNQNINNINNVLDTHLSNNTNTIRKIDAYLKCICKHIIREDYIESGVDENMIKIKYCQLCELTFDE
jgi:hypothetical protein